VNDVEVTIELKTLPRLTGIEADEHRGRGRMAGSFALDCEAVGAKEIGEGIKCGPGIAGRGRNGDEPRCRVEQAVAADRETYRFEWD